MLLQLSDIWQALVSHVRPPAALSDRALTSAVVDSRQAQPHGLFAALLGAKTDGHLFIADAFARGASAVIADPRALELGLHATFVLPDGTLRPAESREGPAAPVVFIVPNSLVGLQKLAAWWRDRQPAVVVGITGSVGKTTTKEVVADVLETHFVTMRSEGNLNSESGLPLCLLRLAPQHERVVLEMGMYDLGEIARLCALAKPSIGIVTNVGPTHLERLGTIERIAQAKSELPQALPPAATGGVAILNADDPLVMGMARLTAARVFTYGLAAASDLWADEITSEGLEGIRFRFHYQGETIHVRLPLLGQHSVHTALCAAAAGLVEGLGWDEIVAGLQRQKPQLRLIVAPGLSGTTLIDDTYNASPVSMLAALSLLDDLANGRRRAIAVLGDMMELGAYEREGHRLVGGRAAAVANLLITVGPRARWIAEEAVADGLAASAVHATADNVAAIALLCGLIREGDIILVKGSRSLGMESIVEGLSATGPTEGK